MHEYSVIVTSEYNNQRLDKVTSELFKDYTRVRIQKWIKIHNVLLNDKPAKSTTRVYEGMQIKLYPIAEAAEKFKGEDIPLNIIYEDTSIIVIDKLAGLVVHPGAGNWSGTLLNALLFHYPDLVNIPRAGIVHRLDKDTTGLLVVAKNERSYTHLVNQLKARTVTRNYIAVVWGTDLHSGTIDLPIGRHTNNRTKMAVFEQSIVHAKAAITHYQNIRSFNNYSLLRLSLETGRTHQIRVHLAHFKHPIIGDTTYGSYANRFHNAEVKNYLKQFKRQALHATQLNFKHPVSGTLCRFDSPTPDDIINLIDFLEKN